MKDLIDPMEPPLAGLLEQVAVVDSGPRPASRSRAAGAECWGCGLKLVRFSVSGLCAWCRRG